MKKTALALVVLLAGCAGPELRRVPDGYARIALACSESAAEVTVDGAPAGTAQDYVSGSSRLLVKPGWHRIELRSASGALAVREALLGAGDDVSIRVELPLNLNGGPR